MINSRHLRPADLKGLRARAYIRESTEEQTERGTPVARQKADILRAIDELGMIPCEPLWYERSGTGEKESAELKVALEDGKRRDYDALVVFATSRFARNRAEAVRMKAEFAKAGIVIYFVADRIISGSYTAALAEGIHEVIDEHGNEERRLYISGGLRERQLSGKWVGTVPYGYRKHMADNADGSKTWDGTLEPDPEQAAVVRRVYADTLGGKSLREIALALNDEGVSGPRSAWRKGGLFQIVRNPIYMGRLVRYRRNDPGHYYPEGDARDGRQDFDAPWVEPLVSEREWAAAQRPFPTVRKQPRSTQRFALSGVIRCGSCGAKMQGAWNARARKYYRCRSRAEDGSCHEPYAVADEVEIAFAEWLGGFQLPKDWRESIARIREGPRKSPDKAKIEAKLERLKSLYLMGDIGQEAYVQERDRLREQLADQAPVNIASLESLAEALDQLGSLWVGDRRPTLPPLIVEKVVVRDGKIAEIDVRAELKPLLELCVVAHPRVRVLGRHYSAPLIRFVA